MSELNGTELERSANVFDLSYVPEDMIFDQEIRWVRGYVDIHGLRLLWQRPMHERVCTVV